MRLDMQSAMRTTQRLILVGLLSILTQNSLSAQVASRPDHSALEEAPHEKSSATTQTIHEYSCGFRSAEDWVKSFQEAVRRGEIADPKTKRIPQVAPRIAMSNAPVVVPTPNTDDIFLFEDSASVLLTNFSFGQLDSLMIDATNALLNEHGDNFDFIGFWVNYATHHTVGAAFYLGIENDVTGIGLGTGNSRAQVGIAGDNVEGFVMMWNINSGFWQPGTASNANFARLVLGQEFEHRFGMFLPDLLDGRPLQGNNGACGRSAHWNFRVDGQGSGMEIAEWVGTDPATRSGGSISFNTDIGGVFSYCDLYLMGYVSPEEMDTGNSELRYLDDNTSCSSPYSGAISNFTSADIIASAGERIPSSVDAQKDFRCGWIMFHLPGSPPTLFELEKAAAILEQHSLDWEFGTLGRGTINNTLQASGVPRIELRPLGATNEILKVGNQIVVAPGGSQVTLDVAISSWEPNLLSAYSAQVDSASYSSADVGTLTPVVTPNVSDGAFIDTGRDDFVFDGVASTTAVDTATLDYVYFGSVDVSDAIADPRGRKYLGSLVLDVPPEAEGTFTVSLAAGTNTFAADGTGTAIEPILLAPARITIGPRNLTCDTASEILCDEEIQVDNRFATEPPDPLYSCGILDNHDGTLWYKFVATDTSARIFTCRSSAQDSTFAVYEGSCGALTPLGCSEDDDCGVFGWLGDLRIDGITVGQTYYIQFSAWSTEDQGFYTLDLGCQIIPPPQPIQDTSVPDAGSGTRNRYLVFTAGDPGASQSIRITVVSAPPEVALSPGDVFWLGQPFQVSENSGVVDPADAPETPSFTASGLQCEPFATDWSTLGAVHSFGLAIVPDATYDVQIVDAGLENDPSAFSNALRMQTSIWGDVVQDCTTMPCPPPDASVDITTDVTSILSKFRNVGGPTKSRADLEPALPDGLVNISDVTFCLNAFSGDGFAFAADANPCP